MSSFRGRFVNVDVDIRNENIAKMLEDYDKVITQYVNLISTSELIGILDDDTGVIQGLIGVYKSILNLGNDAFIVMINQDNVIRNIAEQNTEILKKLDELSEKTTK